MGIVDLAFPSLVFSINKVCKLYFEFKSRYEAHMKTLKHKRKAKIARIDLSSDLSEVVF